MPEPWTPGPWRGPDVEQWDEAWGLAVFTGQTTEEFIDTPEGGDLTYQHIASVPGDDERSKADLRLIAVAPEMAEWLNHFVTDTVAEPALYAQWLATMADDAEVLLARARGHADHRT